MHHGKQFYKIIMHLLEIKYPNNKFFKIEDLKIVKSSSTDASFTDYFNISELINFLIKAVLVTN